MAVSTSNEVLVGFFGFCQIYTNRWQKALKTVIFPHDIKSDSVPSNPSFS